jgi:cell division protein FtsL
MIELKSTPYKIKTDIEGINRRINKIKERNIELKDRIFENTKPGKK